MESNVREKIKEDEFVEGILIVARFAVGAALVLAYFILNARIAYELFFYYGYVYGGILFAVFFLGESYLWHKHG